ncbi:hypothetical protein BVG16_20935 [Paenibacillus selenitireducens]|uniref:Prenylated flavin chaperone LpdD-like domain-containing protein n=1 Tax=Paenibacillus selenitireducens TaxID=1324314 RepID=A0A1T2X7E3_9BACL|nr:hypothetical protein [Paenibacillus selenitireducens]OPA75794.1 hypothetical protein BVG16_20935 [Paenibacillus selenitireducens]
MFEQTILPCAGHQIMFSMVSQGEDLCVTIAGGEKPHIGAVALAQVRPSLADPSQFSASVSVLTLLGHKEDEIAKHVAHKLAVATRGNVVVSCGVHIDDATVAQLIEIDQVIRSWCDTFIDKLSS